ncbi:sugar phosphate isomerase/epimerase family protein [Gemmatimonadota bacterium]
MGDYIQELSRRNFLVVCGGILGASSTTFCGRKSTPDLTAESGKTQSMQKGTVNGTFDQNNPYAGFRMGIQSWCLREINEIDKVIDIVQALGLNYIEIAPSVHLPEESPPEKIRAVVEQFKKAGITIDSSGVHKMVNDEKACRKIFEYTKELGVLAVNVWPSYDALPLVDRLAKEYGIPAAIHNHGPEDNLYAKPEMFREYLSKTSPRVGLCVDTGHFLRSRVDPLAVIDEFPDRIHGIHIKEMILDEQTADWVDIIVGAGELNLLELFTKLKNIDFSGFCSLEYESDPSNSTTALSECLVEIRKACASLG